MVSLQLTQISNPILTYADPCLHISTLLVAQVWRRRTRTTVLDKEDCHSTVSPRRLTRLCDESHESELFLLKHIDTKGHSVLDSFRSILFLKEIPRDQREDDTYSSWVSFVRRVSGHRRPPGEHIIFSAVQSCVKHSC